MALPDPTTGGEGEGKAGHEGLQKEERGEGRSRGGRGGGGGGGKSRPPPQ